MIANCLVQILPCNSADLSSSKILIPERVILGEKLLHENYEISGSNKKAKLELTWSWHLVITLIKDDKDSSKQITWSLISQKLIESGMIPESYLIILVDFIMSKIEEINLDSVQCLKVLRTKTTERL